MNIRLLPLAALLIGLVAACTPYRGKTLAEYPDADAGDSLLYLYAQIRANEYWELARNNPDLKETEERVNFIDGVRKGIEAMRLKGDNEAYNMGVTAGVKIADRVIEFEQRYGIELNDEILLASLTQGLEDSTDEVPIVEVQDEYYRIIAKLKNKRRIELTPKVRMQLLELARKLQLSKIKDNLFYRIEKKGVGPYPNPGDAMLISADYELPDGEVIGMPPTERIVLGSLGIPRVMDRAYSRLNKGSVGIFLTSADAVFGSRCHIMGVNPEDMLIITVTVNDIIPKQERKEYSDTPLIKTPIASYR